ncbi:hypothetical protein ABBQ38_000464 [Trebouxia sp. C0009 RCD-2024]
MVKKKVGGTKSRKSPKAAGTSVATQVQDGPQPPGHVKKRLTKKLHFLERVADSKHKALAATAGIRKKPHKSKSRQKKALPDLHSLAELLADVEQKQAAKQDGNDAEHTNKQKGRTEQINGSKARRTVTQLETQRLQQVLAHPEFQANPLAAIKNHLAATLPEPAPPKAQSRQKKTLQQRRQHKEARQHASMDES